MFTDKRTLDYTCNYVQHITQEVFLFSNNHHTTNLSSYSSGIEKNKYETLLLMLMLNMITPRL